MAQSAKLGPQGVEAELEHLPVGRPAGGLEGSLGLGHRQLEGAAPRQSAMVGSVGADAR
ncbi:MAG: hypothetical protein AB1635_16095 [Acidobacteriota bacterium]